MTGHRDQLAQMDCRRILWRIAAGAVFLSVMTVRTAAGPAVQIKPASADFGTVSHTAEPVVEFEIRNTGDEDLVVTQVRVPCPACVQYEAPKEPIPPAGSYLFRVRIAELPMAAGPVRKLLYLHTNDPERSIVTLSVNGVVEGLYSLSPRDFFLLGRIDYGERREWQYRLSFPGLDKCRITAIEAPTWLAVDAVSGETAGSWDLALRTVPEAMNVGRLAGVVKIETDSGQLPAVRVPVRGTVTGPVTAVPATMA